MSMIRLFFIGALCITILGIGTSSVVFAQDAATGDGRDSSTAKILPPQEPWEQCSKLNKDCGSTLMRGDHYRSYWRSWWGVTEWKWPIQGQYSYSYWQRSKCPPGFAAIGYRGRTGWIVDAIQLICQRMAPNGVWADDRKEAERLGGTGGGDAGEFLCPQNMWLVGTKVRTYNPWVTRVWGYCMTASDIMGVGGNNRSYTQIPNVLAAGEGGGSTSGQISCDKDWVVTSAAGRRHHQTGWLTGFLLGCTEMALEGTTKSFEPYKQTTNSNACWSSCKEGLCESVCGERGYCCRPGHDQCPERVQHFVKNNTNHHECYAPQYIRTPREEYEK